MTRILEIGALTVGAMSLFSVSFLGFAASSGKDLSEVAVIGPLFESREDDPEADPAVLPVPATVESPRSELDIYRSQFGLLEAYRFEPGFDSAELDMLVDELKARSIALDLRERALDDREQTLDTEHDALDEKMRVLEEMKRRLEDFEQELDLREQEVSADESVARAVDAASVERMATILAEGRAADSAKRLVTYSPEEAARFLHAMDPKKATELLNTLRGEEFRTYADAYAAADPGA